MRNVSFTDLELFLTFVADYETHLFFEFCLFVVTLITIPLACSFLRQGFLVERWIVRTSYQFQFTSSFDYMNQWTVFGKKPWSHSEYLRNTAPSIPWSNTTQTTIHGQKYLIFVELMVDEAKIEEQTIILVDYWDVRLLTGSVNLISVPLLKRRLWVNLAMKQFIMVIFGLGKTHL